MNSLVVKIKADLLQHKMRSLLMIASIAAGLFCVGAILGMIDLQLTSMDNAHRAAQPAHINLILRKPAPMQLLSELETVPGVQGIDAQTPATVRFRLPAESRWRLATMLFRADYATQRYDLTRLQSGSWPTNGGLGIERQSALDLNMQSGSQVILEAGKSAKSFKISGVIRHPFVKPPRFGGQAHFFVAAADAAQFGIDRDQFRQLMVRIRPPYSLSQTRKIAVELRTILNRHGFPASVTLLQDPEQHWGRPLVAGINKVLTSMAWAALALACVLVFNSVTAHLTLQNDQIGVMKALGASRWHIFAVYLAEVLLLAVIALVIALPLSAAAAYFSAYWVLDLFNIAAPQSFYSSRTLLAVLAGGLVAPVFAAWWPIMRAAGSSVRAALDSHGIGADFGTSGFDRALERVAARYLPALYAVALGNVFRRKARLLWTQGVLISAGVMLLVTLALRASVNLTLDNELSRTRYDVRLGLAEDQPPQHLRELIQRVPGSQYIEFWQRLPLEMTRTDGSEIAQKGSLGAQILALPAASTLYRPYIVQGRWLRAGDAGERVVVISADTAELNGIKPGDTLKIALGPRHELWRVVGNYRWLAGANYTVEPVYAPLETVQQLTRRFAVASYAVISAQTASLQQESDYVSALQAGFWNNDVKLDVYTTVAKRAQRQQAQQQFKPVTATLLGLTAMITAVAGIGLAGALTLSVLQRYREIAVMRAVGASSGAIFRLFMLEGLIQGLLAWALSVPLAYSAAEPLAKELGKTMLGIQLDYRFAYASVVYWLILIILLTFLSAYWPSRQATRISVRRGLGH